MNELWSDLGLSTWTGLWVLVLIPAPLGCCALVYGIYAADALKRPTEGYRGQQRSAALASSNSFAVLEGWMRKVGGAIAPLPLDSIRRRINAALMRSGEWLGLRADEFLAGSLLSGAAGLLCALVATEGLFAYDVSFSGGMSFAAGPFAAGSFEGRSWVSELPALFVMSSAILFACAPWMYLRLRVKRRLSELELGLSEAVDLLKLCQDTGLSLPDALDHVIRRRVVRPQVQEELQRVRRALKNGQTPRQAFEALAERTPVPSALALASAFAHVEHRQRDLSQAFRLHAAAQRMSRQVEMEENAERAARVLVAPRLLLFGTVLALLLLPVVASGAVFVQ